MTKLILPHTIDAGTDIVAVEHQDNYVAIRDTVNGTLQGGDPAVNGNMAANGITYRELAHNLMKYHTKGPIRQEGVFIETDLKVSPSSGLILAVAAGEAMITDDTGIVFDVGMKVPAKYAGGTVTLDAAHGTLPRVDQIVARITDYETVTIEKLTGTATASAQISDPQTTATYRLGAAALGNDRILLADVIVVATDTVIVAADINDRRPWCRGEMTFDLAAATSVHVFSDLNGTTDVGYILTFLGSWVLTGAGNLRIRPHNVSTNTYHQTYHYVTNGGHTATDLGSISGYDLTTAFGAGTYVMNTTFKLTALTGGAGTYGRTGRGAVDAIRASDATRYMMDTIAAWSDTTINILSLMVDFGGGTFTGKLLVEKEVLPT